MPKLSPDAKVERRRNIVRAAWRRAADSGFRGLTVDEVCDEAGVSKGAFYVYFSEKRDLLLAMLEEEGAALQAVMADLETAEITWIQRLQRLMRSMLERSADPAHLHVRVDLWATMGGDETVRAAFVSVIRRQREALRGWIERAAAAGELADVQSNPLAAILIALGDGLMLHGGLDPTAFRWTNVRRSVDALLEGIGGSAPGAAIARG